MRAQVVRSGRYVRKLLSVGPAVALLLAATLVAPSLSIADEENCLSPYTKILKGDPDFVYVWTLGVPGMGDGSDKLVTINVNPKSKDYGKVVSMVSIGGRHEAHHASVNDDRRYLWAFALDDSRIFIFDLHSDPARPKIWKTITTFTKDTGGVVGPHTPHALPGRMLISGLSNDKDFGGRTALVTYSNSGEYIATDWMPTTDGGDGYGYDVRINPAKNVLLTSSFAGWNNYMMDFGKLLKDEVALKNFGNTMALWNLHTMKPEKIFKVPGAPLEIRWVQNPNPKHGKAYAFATTALTSQIWLIWQDRDDQWQAKAVGDIGDPKKLPLPVVDSLTTDGKGLWVTSFLDGMARYYDISDPFNPKFRYEDKIGSQVNMIVKTWDDKRLFFTSSLLSRWDKTGAEDEQWFKAYTWDKKSLKLEFAIDFYQAKLGRPHQMTLGAYSLYSMEPPEGFDVSSPPQPASLTASQQ